MQLLAPQPPAQMSAVGELAADCIDAVAHATQLSTPAWLQVTRSAAAGRRHANGVQIHSIATAGNQQLRSPTGLPTVCSANTGKAATL